MVWRGRTTIPERLLSALPYILTISVGLLFARPLITKIPFLYGILAPLFALAFALAPFTMGFFGLIPFFILYVAVVRNSNVLHFIRYNTALSILIDIALSLANLALSLILEVFGSIGSIGHLITGVLVPSVGVAALGCCGYAIAFVIQGKYAEMSALSDASYRLTGDGY
ncbi:MAG: Tic20 family protein [Cyanobacteria bacterium J06639_1]